VLPKRPAGDAGATNRATASPRVVTLWVDTGAQVLSTLNPTALRFAATGLQSDLARLKENLPVTIAAPLAPHLAGISLRTVHPAQFVLLRTATPPQINDKVQMADARGKEWRIDPGVLPLGIGVWLPDDMADGAAHVRLVRMVSGEEKLSAPLDLLVTSAPLPLDASAVAWMTPVPPGQWTELHQGLESGSEFELQRVDRVDVEFVQGRVREVSRGIGPDHARVRVPARLKPGVTSVRTRTWIEKTSSEWSAPASYTVLGPAPRGR